jgi:AcrR family transcriptional regulator
MITPVPTRKYEQRLRATAAQDTRRRILEAAYERLREAPAQPVSVDRIARMAGVARSTVYLVFGSRAGLFDALAADLMERSGVDRLLEAVRHPDAREHLRGGLREGARVFAANRDVMRALHSMAALDEDAVGGAVRRMEEQRAKGMTRLARRLAEQDVLRPDLTVEQAADVLWLLARFDAFDQLFTGKGMSVDDAARMLVTTAERTLCR